MFNIKKRFFKRELKQTQAKIWSLEFSRYTTMFEREQLRQQYDQANDGLQRLSAAKDAKKEDVEEMTKRVEAMKQALDEMDIMINGCEPNNQYPDGVRGVTESLQAQIQKRDHIKNFIKQYC